MMRIVTMETTDCAKTRFGGARDVQYENYVDVDTHSMMKELR